MDFIVPIKLTTTMGVGAEKKIQKNLTSQNTGIINASLESLLSESFPSLWDTVHLIFLERPPTLCWSLDLLWRQLIFSSGPSPMCSCLQCPQLSGLVCFPLWELSMSFYIFHKQSLPSWSCGFNLQLVCWWEGFGSFSLATLPLVFNCGFISTSTCGSFTGVCSWGCPGGLGSAPVRARCRGGAAAWVAVFLVAPGTQGSWWLGQQEICCSRRIWQPVLANTLLKSCLENPPSWQRSSAGHSLQGPKDLDMTQVTLHA